MKTHAIAALLVLGVVSSCGQDEPTPANSTTPSVGTPAVAAKPELVPIGSRRVIELEDGVRIEVLAEGQGDFVAPGDEVALSLTLSYVPQPAPKVEETPPTDAPADDAKSSSSKKQDKKPRASKSADSKLDADTAKPDDSKPEDAQSSDPKSVGAKSESGTPAEVAQSESTEAKSGGAQPAVDTTLPTEDAAPIDVARTSDPAPTEVAADSAGAPVEPANTDATPTSIPPNLSAAPAGASEAPPALSAIALDGAARDSQPTARDSELTTPAPEPLAPPLEPIVVLSTKNLGTPIRARVGASSTLVPGLSRALVGLRQGTIAEITLPAEAAYGADGLPSAGIPAGTTLLATIEIREVRR